MAILAKNLGKVYLHTLKLIKKPDSPAKGIYRYFFHSQYSFQQQILTDTKKSV